MPMKVFGKFVKNDTAEENYLALTLTPDKVFACVWNLQNDKVNIAGFSNQKINEENITRQAAAAIDAAAEKASGDVAKVVFGLSSYWLSEGEPTQSTAKLLKSLSKDLELEPEAFVPIVVAINHLLKVRETVTPHAVLLGVYQSDKIQFCEAHLLEGNKVVKTLTAKDHVDMEKIKQLVGQLKENEKELPARIVVYGLEDNSSLLTQIKGENWEHLFVHEPKIEVLKGEELASAAAFAQAQDMIGHEPTLASVAPDQKIDKNQPKVDDLGFVEGEDILLSEPQKIKPPALPRQPEDYAIDTESNVVAPAVAPVIPQNEPPKKSKIPKFNFHFKWKKIGIAALAILVLAFVASYAAGQVLTNAQVIIKVSAQPLEKDMNVTAQKDASLDSLKLQIPAQEITQTDGGSQKAVATGSKKIGQNAKGQITVFNWTTLDKTFPKGTTVIAKSGIKFNLDDDVTSASRSAASPGQAKVNVTAADVGAGGNLAGGQDFRFLQYDELLYSAHNDNAFGGGDSKQITVVSADDLDRLQKLLTDSLTQKAKTDLKNKASPQKLNDNAIIIKVLKKTFDKNALDEASLVNLDMQVEASALVYSEDDLKKLLAASVGPASNNLEARPQNIQILDLNVQKGQNKLTLSGRFRAGLVPKINEDDLKNKIAGQDTKKTREIIKQIPEVSDVIVNFSPNISPFQSIPHDKSKIKFQIETS